MILDTQKTICAISTPTGVGGVAVIRVSGTDAFELVDKLFVAKNPLKRIQNQLPYTLCFGQVVAPESGELLDEVLVSVFKAPHSFTGENVVEIACHGSTYIQQEIVRLLLHVGCALAQPGEFTQRAFLNGKMDLSQAEAIADLIASTSAASNRLAINQMRGGFSNELAQLRDQLLTFTSLVELELDFSEEEVEFADREQLGTLANKIEKRLERLTHSFAVGSVIKNGIPVAIVGETNVGKSTLLNVLLNEERAIVSEVHGTTRDVIEDAIQVGGVLFRFIDTAGIRHTTDVVESMGIERTYKKMEQAQIVLWLIDSTQVSEHIEWLADRIIKRHLDKKVIVIFNKVDKISEEECQVLSQLFANYEAEQLFISAKSRINIEALEQLLLDAAALPQLSDQDVVVTNMRHYESLRAALAAIRLVQNGLQMNISGDLLSQDIRECMHHLGLITGQISTDEVLGAIFTKFCIGK